MIMSPKCTHSNGLVVGTLLHISTERVSQNVHLWNVRSANSTNKVTSISITVNHWASNNKEQSIFSNILLHEYKSMKIGNQTKYKLKYIVVRSKQIVWT